MNKTEQGLKNSLAQLKAVDVKAQREKYAKLLLKLQNKTK